MKRRVLLVLVAAVLASVVMVLSFGSRRNEPSYSGKSLSAWLKAYDWFQEGDPRRTEAATAVRHIGTNALPYLLADLQYKRPSWLQRLRRITQEWPLVGGFVAGMALLQDRVWRADVGFEVLGADAAPAVPELIRILGEEEGGSVVRVRGILVSLGRPALWGLIGTVTNHANSNRLRARAIVAIGAMETNANEAAEQLIACLKDDPEVAMPAAYALEHVSIDKEAIVSAIESTTKGPDNTGCIAGLKALGNFGVHAQSAVPTITTFLTNENADIRLAATNALSWITGEKGAPPFAPEPPYMREVRPLKR